MIVHCACLFPLLLWSCMWSWVKPHRISYSGRSTEYLMQWFSSNYLWIYFHVLFHAFAVFLLFPLAFNQPHLNLFFKLQDMYIFRFILRWLLCHWNHLQKKIYYETLVGLFTDPVNPTRESWMTKQLLISPYNRYTLHRGETGPAWLYV